MILELIMAAIILFAIGAVAYDLGVRKGAEMSFGEIVRTGSACLMDCWMECG